MADINFDRIMELMGDDHEVLVEMLEVFLEDMPIALEEIETGWKTNNLEQVRATSHKLKSSITWLNLMEAHDSLNELELFAVNGGDTQVAEKNKELAIQDCTEALVIIAEKLKEIKSE